MVAIFTGEGVGLERGSAWVLGSRGRLGSANLGRSGEGVYVNAANGNLVVTRQDEFLIGVGPDSTINRTYNSQGDLSDDNGDNWQLSVARKVAELTGNYGDAGSTVTRFDWDGSDTLYTWDDDWNEGAGAYVATDGAGAYDTLTFAGSTWTWTDGGSLVTELYDNNKGGRITSTKDTFGKTVSYTYDAVTDLLTRVTTSNGEYTEFVRDTSNRVTEMVTYASGAIPMLTRTHYAYDTYNRLSSVTVDLTPEDHSVADAKKYVTTYVYVGSSKRLARIMQSDTSWIDFTYVLDNGQYRIATLSQLSATGVARVTSFDYDTAAGITTITDASGNITRMSYDGNGNLTEILHPAANASSSPQRVTFGYDQGTGDVTSAVSGNGNAVTYTYDEHGNLEIERDAAGNTIKRFYDEDNRLERETRYLVPDPDAIDTGASPGTPQTTRFVYDDYSRLKYIITAEGHVTEYVYGAAGLQTTAIEYAGNVYDLSGLTDETSLEKPQLDAWVGTIADKSTNRRTETTYDFRGNVASVISFAQLNSGGTGTVSTGSNMAVITAGANTNVTAMGAGVYRIAKTGTVDAYDAVATAAYTITGDFAFRLRPQQADKRFAAGVAASPGSTNGIADLSFGLEFQADGTVDYVEGAASASLGSYAAGEDFFLVRKSGTISYHKGKTLEAALASPALRTVANATGTFYFDAAIYSAGAIGDVQLIVGSGLAIPTEYTKINYFYDSAGNLLARHHSGQIAYESFIYDGLGRMVGSTDYNGEKTTIVFTDASNKTAITLANGLIQTSFYNRAGELITYTETGTGVTTATTSYRYDSLGRLRVVTDPTGQQDFFFYDDAGRKIASIDADGSVVEYRYDANNNFTSSTAYASRLTAQQIDDLADAGGNPTAVTFDEVRPATHADDRWDWRIYDAAQRLVQTIDGTGATTVFTYDGASRLVSTKAYANRLTSTTLTTLKSSAANPNLWANPTNGALWTKTNANVASADPIDGLNAFQFTVAASGGVSMITTSVASVPAGTVSYTVTLKAVGTITTHMIGIYATPSGWGANADNTADIVSGPGTLVQNSGGLWTINGLSTTEATRITFTRKLYQTETFAPRVYIRTNAGSSIAGEAVILSNPVINKYPANPVLTLPTADAAKDRVERHFHDADGRLVGTIDAEGYLTEIRYDEAGLKKKTIAYSDAADPAAADFATALASVTPDNAKDIHNYFLHDARGLLRATIDGEGNLTRIRYSAFEEVDQVIKGQKLDPAALIATPPTLPTLPAAGSAILNTVTYTRNRYGQVLTEVRSLTGAVTTTTVYNYDAMRRLVSTVTQSGGPDPRTYSQRYDLRGRLTSELSGDGNAALAALGSNPTQTQINTIYTQYGWTYTYDAADRLITKVGPKGLNPSGPKTLYYYNPDGALAYEVNALGEVTEYRYNAFGARTDAIVYAGRIAPATLSTMTGGFVTQPVIDIMVGVDDASVDTATHVDFNVDGTVKQSTDPLGNLSTFTYDAFGGVLASEVALLASDKIRTSRTFDRRGLLEQEIVDSESLGKLITTTYGYDAFGRAVTLTDPGNHVTESTYDRAGRLTSTTNALDQTTTYNYDPRGNLIRVTDAANNITRYVYDKANRRIATIDALGGVVTTIYDADGRVLSTRAYATALTTTALNNLPLEVPENFTKPGQTSRDQVTYFAYDKDGQLRFTLDGLMQLTEFANDAAGNVVRTTVYGGTVEPDATGVYSLDYLAEQAGDLATQAESRFTRSIYDAANRLAFSIDAMKKVTQYFYDTKGAVTRQIRFEDDYDPTTDPLLGTMNSWVTSHANAALDRTTRAFYDQKGQLSFSVDAEGYVTEYQYDKVGNVLEQTRYADNNYSIDDTTTKAGLDNLFLGDPPATAAVTKFVYDTAGRLERVIDPEGVVTFMVLDDLGQIQSSTVAYGTTDASTTTRTYDAVGRILSETRAAGTTDETTRTFDYSSTAPAQTVTETDGRGFDTVRTYNVLGQLVMTRVEVDAIDTNDLITENFYDTFGNVWKSIDARLNPSYFYHDALNRLTLHVDAEKYATQTVYTRGGQTKTVTRFDARTTGTPTVSAPPTLVVDANKDAVTRFEYDKLDRLTKVTDAENHYESYTLDAFGDRISVRNKLGGITTNEYYRNGLLKTESVDVDWANSSGSAQTDTIVNKFEYDARGNRTKTIEAFGRPEVRTTNHVYDRNDRLVETTGDAVQIVAQDLATVTTVTPKQTFSYDKRGNLIKAVTWSGAQVLSQTFAYYDDANRKTGEVNAAGTLTWWEYDGNGNVESARIFGDAIVSPPLGDMRPMPVNASNYRETTFTYDGNNRLKTTSVASLLTGEYSGTFTKTTGTVTTEYKYDGGGNVVSEKDGRGNFTYSWYDKLGRRTSQVDREKYLTTWTLDSDGNVTEEKRFAKQIVSAVSETTVETTLPTLAGTDGADRITQFLYDRNGRRTQESRLYIYSNKINSVTGALETDGVHTTIFYFYNGLGQIWQKTEGNNDYFQYGYDTIGREVWSMSGPFADYLGASVQLSTDSLYDGLGNLTRSFVHKQGDMVEANGRVTTYTYGAGGRLASTTDAASFTRNFGYDAAGRVVKESYLRTKSDGVTQVEEAIAHRYDAGGRLIAQAMATKSGSTWTFGDATRIRYNAYGEMTGRGITAGPDATAVYQETFDYDNGGRLWRSNSGDGVLRFYMYDKAGNQTLTLASAGADLSALTPANYSSYISSSGDTTLASAVTTVALFDKRGQQTQTREPDRQLTSGTTALVVRGRTYNAFGEVASEIDPRGFDASGNLVVGNGYTTTFAYNTMGRMISKVAPLVGVTGENGATTNANPTETYHYDRAGRLIGVLDANLHLITRTLLAGTGHGGGEALVTAEFHPDGGVARTFYDVFGDARILRNEVSLDETRSYDKMGRLTQQVHRGGLLTDYYGYDGLGQRTRHWNSMPGSHGTEETDYDAQGRVTRTRAFGGDVTTTVYAWNGALTNDGLSGTTQIGGWTELTTFANTRDLLETSDVFGHLLKKVDLADAGTYDGHEFIYAYDRAGRLTSQEVGDETTNYNYLNTGLVSSISRGSDSATYGYDAAGNRTSEYTIKGTVVVQNATANYDALNRMIGWDEIAATATTPAANIDWKYDAVGNVMNIYATYRKLDEDGGLLTGGVVNDSQWYRYDAMNRLVTDHGMLAGGQVVRTSDGKGVDYSYNAAGQRMTAARTDHVTVDIVIDEANGTFHTVHRYPNTIDTYVYNDDGTLSAVWIAVDDVDDVTGQLTVGTSMLRSVHSHDAMGRLNSQTDYWANGQVAWQRYNIAYNAKGQITDETTTRRAYAGNGNYDVFTDVTHNEYGSGATYALGAALTVSVDTSKNYNDGDVPDTFTTNSYAWWDSAVQSAVAYKPNASDSSTWDSTYSYSASGQLNSVTIDDGRDRTITYTNDMLGQIIRRDETDDRPEWGDPHEVWYRFNGRQVGFTGNNGTANVDYNKSIEKRTVTPYNTLAFRWGESDPTAYGDFSLATDPINSFGQGSSGGGYTVRAGDTLQTVAMQLWGDANLWYKLAEANGLSAASGLIEGQSLTIPAGVMKSGHSASTFKPYDPADAIGETSPTNPKPGRNRGCGMMGQILLIAIAVAVSVITAGAALAAFAPAAAGITSISAGISAMAAGGVVGGVSVGAGAMVAAGAIGGAVGSIASQAVGVATHQQSKFNWKGVAMSAIAGGIGAGMGHFSALSNLPASNAARIGGTLGKVGKFLGGNGFVSGAARGALSSAMTQGIGVATGLQDKFSWAGVAGAGVASGLSAEISGPLGAGSLVGNLTARNILANTAVSTAAAFTNAATRSLLTGTDFGDNLMAAIPDVIGSTIGNLIGGSLAQRQNEIVMTGGSRSLNLDIDPLPTSTNLPGPDLPGFVAASVTQELGLTVGNHAANEPSGELEAAYFSYLEPRNRQGEATVRMDYDASGEITHRKWNIFEKAWSLVVELFDRGDQTDSGISSGSVLAGSVVSGSVEEPGILLNFWNWFNGYDQNGRPSAQLAARSQAELATAQSGQRAAASVVHWLRGPGLTRTSDHIEDVNNMSMAYGAMGADPMIASAMAGWQADLRTVQNPERLIERPRSRFEDIADGTAVLGFVPWFRALALQARTVARVGAAVTAGPRLIGSYTPSANLRFGTTLFGDEAHVQAARILQEMHPNVAFDFRVLPGQRGIDVTVVRPRDIGSVGFEFGEIKPLTASGERTMLRQLDRWGLTPQQVRPITYDADGNIYYGFR